MFYSKCKNLKDAKMEFCGMPLRNEISWNAMIMGNSQHRYGQEALELIGQMRNEPLKPNHATLWLLAFMWI